eukprot:1160102-Pelagomonas_calceolata.AAC.1
MSGSNHPYTRNILLGCKCPYYHNPEFLEALCPNCCSASEMRAPKSASCVCSKAFEQARTASEI